MLRNDIGLPILYYRTGLIEKFIVGLKSACDYIIYLFKKYLGD